MKVALIMIMCSQIAGECMKPHFLRHHDSFSECLIGGYEESIKKINELGSKEVNKHEIVIKFKCYYDTSTQHEGA
jgi:hypothetical protein|tara:strand:- start:17280 stop:17504 length:225 start_codon:yes stop_codon:yes gene_type:complete